MSDATTALAAAQAAAASASTAGEAATGAAESVATALAHRNAAQTARDEAQDAAQTAADDAVAAVGPVNDTVMTSVDGNAASAYRVQADARLAATFDQGDAKVVYCGPGGNDALFNGKLASAPKKTLVGALTAMGTGVKGTIRLLPGDIDAGSGVSWTGYKCGIVGAGPLATYIRTTAAQVGPVLDLTGVNYDLAETEIGGFSLYGDGTAGTTKKGLALDPNTSMVRAHIHDIVVHDTGGAPFDFGQAELCALDRLIAYEPVSAAANDVPYFTASGAFNGNTFTDCQLHGVSAGASVGASGAVVFTEDAAYAPHDNALNNFKLENLHVPTGGTIFSLETNTNVISDPQFFDCSKVSGATGTSHIRLEAAGTYSFLGGNVVRGVIPGKGTNPTDLDCGVDVRQSRNTVVGVKGYRGTNVILAAGVGYTHVELFSAQGDAWEAVVDNSGQTTNTIIDHYNRTEKRPGRTFTEGSNSVKLDIPSGGLGPGQLRISDPATPANGTLGLGTSGTKAFANGTSGFFVADAFTFRKIDGTQNVTINFATGPKIRIGQGSPETVEPAGVGSHFIRTDGSESTAQYVKGSGSGNTGWRQNLVGLTASATLDFPSVAAAGSQELTVTVTGAAAGDMVSLGAPAAIEAGLIWNGYVSAANTVKVRVSNITAAAIDPTSATWKVGVIKP